MSERSKILEKKYSRYKKIDDELMSLEQSIRTAKELADEIGVDERELAGNEENRIQDLLEERKVIAKEMISDFRGLNDPIVYQILKRHYLDGDRWADIARDMHYHEKSIYRIRNRAFEKIENDRKKNGYSMLLS